MKFRPGPPARLFRIAWYLLLLAFVVLFPAWLVWGAPAEVVVLLENPTRLAVREANVHLMDGIIRFAGTPGGSYAAQHDWGRLPEHIAVSGTMEDGSGIHARCGYMLGSERILVLLVRIVPAGEKARPAFEAYLPRFPLPHVVVCNAATVPPT